MQRMSRHSMNLFFDDDDVGDYYPEPEKHPNPFDAFHRRIYELEEQLAEVNHKYAESVNLCMSLSQASDAMKLQLILSGVMTLPPKSSDRAEEFKQNNPADQFVAIISGIEGLALNAADGTCVDAASTGARVLALIESLKKLHPYVRKSW